MSRNNKPNKQIKKRKPAYRANFYNNKKILKYDQQKYNTLIQ